jgi:hypothetical protein
VKPIVIVTLTAALCVTGPAFARAERVPELNVQSSCHSAQTYGMTNPQQTYKNCMQDENEAKKQLQTKWSHYKASTRRACLAAGANPSPSYVELLTCIEMTEEVLHPNSGLGGSAPSGAGTGAGATGGGGAGGGAVGGSPPPTLPAPVAEPRAMPR